MTTTAAPAPHKELIDELCQSFCDSGISNVHKRRLEIANQLTKEDLASKEADPLLEYALADTTVLQVLIDKGADVNRERDFWQDGGTALHELASDSLPDNASPKKHIDTLKILLAAGANPNFQDKKGNTPLHYALSNLRKPTKLDSRNPETEACKGEIEFIRLLLEAGANPNIPNNKGITPLQETISNEQYRYASSHSAFRIPAVPDPEVVKLLLEHGGDVNAKVGNEPLSHWAVKHSDKNSELLAHVMQKADLRAADEKGNTLLHVTVPLNAPDHVATLIKRKSDIHAENKLEQTPLHIAAASQYDSVDNSQALKLLIDAGARLDTQDKNGDTPLHTAVEYSGDDTKFVKMLLTEGAKPNMQNGRGDTPLHIAAEDKHVNVMQQLLEQGADPTIRNNTKQKPSQMIFDSELHAEECRQMRTMLQKAELSSVDRPATGASRARK